MAGRCTIKSIAEESRVHPGTVYRWIQEYKSDSEDAFPGSGNCPASEAENRRLEKSSAKLAEENEIIKKMSGIRLDTYEMKYEFVRRHRKQHTVNILCRTLKISRSAYYAWEQEKAAGEKTD